MNRKETADQNGNSEFPFEEEKGNADSPDNQAFRGRLSALVEEFGGAVALGERAGIKESTIRGWAKGPSEPRRSDLTAISDACNVELDWLMTGRGAKTRVWPTGDEAAVYGAPRLSEAVDWPAMATAVQMVMIGHAHEIEHMRRSKLETLLRRYYEHLLDYAISQSE